MGHQVHEMLRHPAEGRRVVANEEYAWTPPLNHYGCPDSLSRRAMAMMLSVTTAQRRPVSANTINL
jgi:hypothetical protein